MNKLLLGMSLAALASMSSDLSAQTRPVEWAAPAELSGATDLGSLSASTLRSMAERQQAERRFQVASTYRDDDDDDSLDCGNRAPNLLSKQVVIHLSIDANGYPGPRDFISLKDYGLPNGVKCVIVQVASAVSVKSGVPLTGMLGTGIMFENPNPSAPGGWDLHASTKVLANTGHSQVSNENTPLITLPVWHHSAAGGKVLWYRGLNLRPLGTPPTDTNRTVVFLQGWYK